jgi:hypothetical protein
VDYIVIRYTGSGHPENDGPQQGPHQTDVLRPFAENSDVTGQKEGPPHDGHHALQDRSENERLDDSLERLWLGVGGETVEKPGGKETREKIGDDPNKFFGG